jgi:hypothetical protein
VQTALQKDGQQTPAAGQVASLTSSNNLYVFVCWCCTTQSQFLFYSFFSSINFCLTQKGVPLTNGAQIKNGSCNPTIVRAEFTYRPTILLNFIQRWVEFWALM